MTETLIIIAHSGLEKKISEDECKKALPDNSDKTIFIDFNI